MKKYAAFLAKELLESARTYKLLILLVVFLIFGLMNPITAKFTPELVSAFLPEGMSMTLPPPVALDSWAQFFKNVTQMGAIVMVVLLGNAFSSELTKGTLVNLLTKGLSRTAVVLAKYTAMLLLWSASLALSFFVTLGYTLYLFPGQAVAHLPLAVFCLWLFGALLLAVLLLGATLVRSSFGAMLITGGAVVIMMLLQLFPKLAEFSPLLLAGGNMDLLTGAADPSAFTGAIIVSAIALPLLVAIAVLVFRRRQI